MQTVSINSEHPVQQLPLSQISHNPRQPRKTFDDEELLRLSESIRNHGILQPLVVRKAGEDQNQYQLIAGERRLRAAHLVGLPNVPVHIVDFNDQQVFEAALAENIQRADLNPIEKAQGFQDYLDKFQLNKDQLAQKLGMDRTTVSNIVSLLTMPREVQDALRLGQITIGHAKVLKGMSAERQVALCKDAVLRQLSVKALELLARSAKTSKSSRGKATETEQFKTPHVTSIEDSLRQKLATKFEIKLKDKEKGSIIIHFENNDDFERIVEALQK
ncbi:ParB/RepB/Spo0J family partition protein [Telmatocola sphagniphila]|uniref:ParB/RepB/Spo0J family partition protein n=1 Tax=Telmatocola sphagniphila TaxID=1123043 RepID=A0A8E6B4I0_9BACT|nr:ParB/RepB/Spo0J family partition protein [Telmatocola sphagniphila]QVL31172.1 ParB/RepB/Spo0J family partition protein [Telmatocola sphagniphila]